MSLNTRANIIPEKTRPTKRLSVAGRYSFAGTYAGDTIRELEGETMFNLVETIRQTSVRFRRDQDEAAEHELDTILNHLSHKETIAVVRAFSYFSLLSNIAEDLHHNRRRRAHLRAGSLPRMAVSRWLCNA